MSRSQTEAATPSKPVEPGCLGLTGIQETHDPCHWERVSQPWEVLGTALDARPFHNHKVFVATPNCIVYRESFASPIRARALSPEGMLALLVPLQAGSRSTCFRRAFEGCELPAMLPGAAEATMDAGHEHIMVLIRLTLLRRLLTEEQWTGLEAAAAGRSLPVSSSARQRLAAWLGGLLDRVHQAPSLLQHGAAVAMLERELVAGLSAALGLRLGSERPVRSSVRRRGFERAIEHLRQADLGTMHLPDLAAAAGVSRRTLAYAFQEHLGLSPTGFVRLLRLHALRRELLAGRLGLSTVTELAYHLGFTQLGRLAREYHVAFGERPSETLARPLRDDAPGFWIASFDPGSTPEMA